MAYFKPQIQTIMDKITQTPATGSENKTAAAQIKPKGGYDAIKQAEQKRNSRIYVGIDPDAEKSGVAIYFRNDKSLILKNLTFFELFDELKRLKNPNSIVCGYSHIEYPTPLLVVVEAGWKNTGHWHTTRYDSIASAAAKGNSVGRNHETGRKIVEMCEYLGIGYLLVTPTASKRDATQFKLITKHEGRTNQEQRDAALLVFGR